MILRSPSASIRNEDVDYESLRAISSHFSVDLDKKSYRDIRWGGKQAGVLSIGVLQSVIPDTPIALFRVAENVETKKLAALESYVAKTIETNF